MTTPAFTQARPVPMATSATLPWLFGAVVFGLLLYYFIGIDEGATSVRQHDGGARVRARRPALPELPLPLIHSTENGAAGPGSTGSGFTRYPLS
jgi:hypothetical protein